MNPIKHFSEVQKQLDDFQREKHALVSEITRLARLRAHLQQMNRESAALPQQLEAYTTALSYQHQPPVNYVADRYVSPIQHQAHLHQLGQSVQDDQICSANAFTRNGYKFTNLAGIGGVLGCQTGFGGRIVPLERFQCYLEELKTRLKPPQKKETDSDFDRVGSALTVLNQCFIDQPLLVSKKQQITPLGRVLAEAHAQKDVQKGIQPDSSELLESSRVNELVANNLNNLKMQTRQFCETHRFRPSSDMLRKFERDRCAVRQMKGYYDHDTDFSLSCGWKLGDEHYEAIREKLITAVANLGSIDFPVPLPDAKPLSTTGWELWKLAEGAQHIQ